jgi:acetolactate synthase-1/2/3 large subunit
MNKITKKNLCKGGFLVTKALHTHGVDRIFCVAGESYLPVLDALLEFPNIHVVTCRHESGATFMAEAYAQLTGKPGIAFVTRAPGACNGSIGIHAAKQSSAPVLLFVGLIGTYERDRESFQDFDLPQMFGSLSKYARVIDRTDRIEDYITHGFHVATSGRPGPVVFGLPEDILTNTAEHKDISPLPPISLKPSADDLGHLKILLEQAKHPLMLVGGSLWDDKSCHALEHFAEKHSISVAACLRRQDIFNHNHDCYIGDVGFGPNPKLIAHIKKADLILAIGTRLDEITLQGYTLLQPTHKLVHVYPVAEEFGKTGAQARPTLPIQAHIAPFIDALSQIELKTAFERQTWCEQARQDYLAWTYIPEQAQSQWNGADMTQVFRQLRELLPDDAIITGDAGNFSGWLHRYLRFGRPGRAFSPICGGMGYAVPTAVGCSIAWPDKTVVGICGDGGFMMSSQELATAAHHGAKPIIIVCNNNLYGTIRMHQERDYPGRHSATALTNPDFVKLGESYGCHATRITHAEQFNAAWQKALDSGKAVVIEIQMDPRQITTNTRIDD